MECSHTSTDLWLKKLIDEMKASIKHSMKKSLRSGVTFKDYAIQHYTEPVEIVSLAALETIWVEVVEQALTDPTAPLNKIKELYRLLTAKINALCSEVIHSNSGNSQPGAVATTNQVEEEESEQGVVYML